MKTAKKRYRWLSEMSQAKKELARIDSEIRGTESKLDRYIAERTRLARLIHALEDEGEPER